MCDEQDEKRGPGIPDNEYTDPRKGDTRDEDLLVRTISRKVEDNQEEMLDTFMAMLRIPAISPVNGGEGEGRKAEFILDLLNGLGMDDIQVFTAEDTVPRPNIIAIKHGKDRSRRLWIMTHLDVVPPGDLSLWQSDPFEPEVRDGRIYARGSEDNGQGLMASIFALRALNDLGIEPAMDIGLALVADEEMGSQKGIQYLLEKDIFRSDDLIIVPDAGNEDGTMLEVAEKSIMWLKITTKGQQCHASTPEEGKNAMTAGMRFCLLALDELNSTFNDEDEIFLPPCSTFEPTKKEKNVLNINTIPGEDVFYLDCRVLPGYTLDSVLDTLEMIVRQVEESEGVKITMETVQREQAAPATPANAIVVRSLANAVRIVYENDPEPIGIGGGTCAAFFRRTGCEAVVWGKIHEVAHSPNEYAVIENVIGDTKVFSLLYAGVGIVDTTEKDSSE